ncbi:hypothetical protein H1C71_018437, partial [Ictidomys tridecemlineatus]
RTPARHVGCEEQGLFVAEAAHSPGSGQRLNREEPSGLRGQQCSRGLAGRPPGSAGVSCSPAPAGGLFQPWPQPTRLPFSGLSGRARWSAHILGRAGFLPEAHFLETEAPSPALDPASPRAPLPVSPGIAAPLYPPRSQGPAGRSAGVSGFPSSREMLWL